MAMADKPIPLPHRAPTRTPTTTPAPTQAMAIATVCVMTLTTLRSDIET